MKSLPEMPRAAGFMLPVVMALIAIAAMLAGSALSEGVLNQTLSTTHELQARAFLVAETLLSTTAQRMNLDPVYPGFDWPRGDATATVRTITENTTPAGFSANRFIERLVEVQSTARAARGVQTRLTEGLGRIEFRSTPCDVLAALRRRLPPAITSRLSIFNRSITAMDTDSDGAVDRLYAGDRDGRLWRFDLYHADGPAPRLAGGVMADFRVAQANRGFIAPPDVTLLQRADGQLSFQIAIGTANTAAGSGANRFFLVYDNAPFEHWDQDRYDNNVPLTVADLAATARGFALDLGGDQIVAPSITVAGSTYLARIRSSLLLDADCDADLSADQTLALAALASATGLAADLDQDGEISSADLNWILPGKHRANSLFSLRSLAPPRDAICLMDGIDIPGCGVRQQFARRYWRREGLD